MRLDSGVLECAGDLVSRLVMMGLMGLPMACYGGLWGRLSRLTKSIDHPSMGLYESCVLQCNSTWISAGPRPE